MKLYVVTVNDSYEGIYYQQIHTNEKDAREDFEKQEKESVSNSEEFDEYEGTIEENENWHVVQQGGNHIDITLREFDLPVELVKEN